MKKALLLMFVFLCGLLIGAGSLYLLVGRGPAMVYAGALEGMADAALKVRLGEQERFLDDFEKSAPGYSEATRSFGDYDFVARALRKVEAYYAATGIPTPEKVSAAIASLSVEGSQPVGSYASEQARATRVKIGDAAPVVSFDLINGEVLNTEDKVTVLNFFATWCAPCMQELPRLEKDIWNSYRADGVSLIAIGRGHSVSELRRFSEEEGYQFPFVADPKEEIYEQFASSYIPRCVVIGKDGEVKHHTVGFNLEDYTGLIRAVKHELREKDGAPTD